LVGLFKGLGRNSVHGVLEAWLFQSWRHSGRPPALEAAMAQNCTVQFCGACQHQLFQKNCDSLTSNGPILTARKLLSMFQT